MQVCILLQLLLYNPTTIPSDFVISSTNPLIRMLSVVIGWLYEGQSLLIKHGSCFRILIFVLTLHIPSCGLYEGMCDGAQL